MISKRRWDATAAAGSGNNETWVDFVRKRKLRKKKVAIAANHYNRDEKKGMEYLRLSQLVPTPPEPRSMAFFLRYSPGLDKNKIGELLGDPEEQSLRVLKEFTETFDFTGVILDTALRTYLETFRLPGESQKIQRILEAFSERFYEQQTAEFTTLLNPYATTEETLFTFSNELKPRMATLALFTITNRFGESVRGAWKNVVDCLLKLKRLKLLPLSLVDQDGGGAAAVSTERLGHRAKSESGVIFPSSHRGAGTSRHVSGMIGRFSQFLSLDAGGESLLSVGSEFENNLKIIQQCRIGSIFTESGKLPDESVQNLGRALIFAGGGKGQKFSTPVEEEETECTHYLYNHLRKTMA
ncbi:hypothetical protein OsI_18861 [Oryza sativa Indica Group]|uniref:SEC7 domain-containing protein n=1 Tax=Oryza sativa subsp. indica TaxID=39946 RepID=B8AZ58_ORYSI|nr:hypothetical protein OsI_18861 [Oryza sativa Indica Group]